MKKLSLNILIVFLSLTFVPTLSQAEKHASSISMVTTETVESVEARALFTRLNEINAIDKSTLKSSEKKNLRKEVRSIKSRLKELEGGIYLSVGAIILIVILLILLL